MRFSGKRLSQGTMRCGPLVIHAAMRARVISGDGMDVRQRMEGLSKTIFVTQMIDWGTFIFSTLRDQLLMEEFL